jgi:hypothetical protein
MMTCCSTLLHRLQAMCYLWQTQRTDRSTMEPEPNAIPAISHHRLSHVCEAWMHWDIAACHEHPQHSCDTVRSKDAQCRLIRSTPSIMSPGLLVRRFPSSWHEVAHRSSQIAPTSSLESYRSSTFSAAKTCAAMWEDIGLSRGRFSAPQNRLQQVADHGLQRWFPVGATCSS